MFQNKIPPELEILIYKFYFTNNILQIIKTLQPIYKTMSQNLINLVNKDLFFADPKYFLEKDSFTDHLTHLETNLFCTNCYFFGFKCPYCKTISSDEWIILNLDHVSLEIYNKDILDIYNKSNNLNYKYLTSNHIKKKILEEYQQNILKFL